MRTKTASLLILFSVTPAASNANAVNSPQSYLIGGIVAVLILGYLIYSLLHPEKF
jgi:K+-transporting ATPase KdpF subunit